MMEHDQILSTAEWEALLTETPPRLAQLVARLAVHHGHRQAAPQWARLKWAPNIDHDSQAARTRD